MAAGGGDNCLIHVLADVYLLLSIYFSTAAPLGLRNVRGVESALQYDPGLAFGWRLQEAMIY